MSLINRYSGIDKAVLIATGNSIVLCGDTQAIEVNTAKMIKPDGTETLDWTEAGSTANLSILANSTILYAELIWYSTVSSSYPNADDVQTTPDRITFRTPAGIYDDLTPDHIENYQAASGSIHRYRAADVTDKIRDAFVAAHEGEYTVSHIPTSISTSELCDTAGGWTLVVIYRNDTFAPKRITFSSGIAFANSENPIQTSITGFTAPGSESDLSGSLYIACANGKPLAAGESLKAGSSFAYLTPLGNQVGVGNNKPGTSPNNPYDNIFAGQINVCNPLSINNGLLDTSGSGGSINHNAFLPEQVNLARNKWDITQLDLIGGLEIDKNQIAIQYTQNELSPGVSTPGIEWLAVGSQISAVAPNITATLVGYDIDGDTHYTVEVGESFTFLFQIQNTGTAAATNVMISSQLNEACQFIANSLKINGITQTGADIEKGVNIGSIPPSGVTNVLYQVRITEQTVGGLINENVNYQYQFLSGSGSPVYTNYANTNVLEIFIEQGNLKVEKVSNSPTAVIGDTIHYTVTVTNTGTEECTDVFLQDRVSDAYCTFVPHSVMVDGVVNYDANPESGVALENLAVGESVVVAFDSTVNAYTPNSIVYNTAYVNFNYIFEHYTKPIKKTIASNTTQVEIQYYEVIGYRVNDNNYPNVGDIVTYALSLTNVGNIPATNVYVKEQAIEGTSFVAGSVVITPGTTPPNLNPFTGFELPSPIEPQESVTITYQIKIEELQQDELIENIANVPFQYQIEEGTVIDTEKDSNKVTTRSNFVTINMTEKVDKNYATVDDILYYSVNLKNDGNIDAFNTTFLSTLQTDTLFVTGSVAINGMIQPDFNPEDGFSVGTISPGDTIHVAYRARVLQVPNPNVIYNQSQLIYDALPDPTGQHITTTSFSETVQTMINKASYTITKTADKAYAQVGDYIVYTIDILNNGTVDLTNVSFVDNLPVYVSFAPGTVYIDSIHYEDYNPVTGFSLANIHPTEHYTVIFGVEVISVPPIVDIKNSSLITLTYQENPTSPIITETTYSSEAVTKVIEGNVDVTKSMDKSYATIGDMITYTTLVANTGNTTVNEVNLIDTIPTAIAHYLQGSLTVNGITVEEDPNEGVMIGSLTVGQVVSVKYSIIVDSVPSPNVLNNVATANYRYYADPDNPQFSKSSTSNTVTTIINIGSANITKQVDKTYATVGDTLVYTIVASNTGTVALLDMNFIDPIPSNGTFVTDSVKIDGETKAGYVPNTGFSLSDIPVGGSTTVTFEIEVNSVPSTPPEPPQINNTATIDYKYKINPSGISREESITTSLVTTYINQMNVSNVKTVDKEYATINDILTYQSTITNNGNVVITDTNFTDAIPIGTTFQAGTVKINNNLTNYDPSTGFLLGDILAGETVVVEFQVKVTSLPGTWECKNQSNLTFHYKLNPTEPDIVSSVDSNTVISYIRLGNLDIAKHSNVTEAMKGNTIRYNFEITNTGNTTISEISFRDPVQSPQSNFVAGSLYLNGNSTTYNPTGTGFTLPLQLKPKEIAYIYFDVTVDSEPAPNETQYNLLNIAYLGYHYKINPAEPDIVVSDKPSNQTTVTIKKMILLAVKEAAGNDTAAIGETLTFTTTLQNTGSVDATGVFFKDIVDKHLSFQEDSVTIQIGDNAPINYETVDPNNGFYLPDPTAQPTDPHILPVGETIKVTFQVTVIAIPVDNIVYNSADIEYDYTVDTTVYHIETKTNTTQTYIAMGELTLSKEVDKAYATIGDELIYTNGIENTGSVDATSIKFKDPIPENTVLIPGSILIDGTATSYTSQDLVEGIPLEDLQPYETHSVVYHVYVDSLPESGEAVNIAHVDFEYEINSQTYSETVDSLPVSTEIHLGMLSINKYADLEYATIGDRIEYTFTIKNEGNVPCSGILFQDSIQVNAEFELHSVYIDGVQQYSANPNDGFPMDDIAGGETKTVVFAVTVQTLPGNYLLNNKANTNYSYYIDPDKPYITTSSTSNTVTTTIRVSSLTLTKDVNLAYATLEDVIEYTVTVANNGNVDAANINFRDVIPSGLTFIPDSVTINGKKQSGYDPYDSFSIGSMKPGNSSIITFQSTVTSVPDSSLIVNKAVITFSYFIDPSGPELFKEMDSNEVTTRINIGELKIIKDVDYAYATIGDILTYSLKITNTGNIDATNVIVTDGLQSDLQFNEGTVVINGGSPTDYDPATGIFLGTINPLGEATVLFTVTIKDQPTNNVILNYGDGIFSYKIDPNGNTYTKTAVSNTVSTILINPDLSSTKVVDVDYATLENYLNYKIVIANTGNTIINQVFFKDYLSEGAVFTPGSVLLNGETEKEYDPIEGFLLPDILAGDIVNIQFRAQVTSVPSPTPEVTNYAVTTGKYKIDPAGEDHDISTTTETVSTTIHVGNVSAVKSVDYAYANVGDNLTYTSTLTNTGNVDSTKVWFFDTLSSEITFVPGSVVIDGVKDDSLDPNTGFEIGTIVPDQSVNVEFEVKVNALPTPPHVDNQSQVEFSYKVDPKGSTITKTNFSNIVSTQVVLGELTATKTVDKGIATIGDEISYTIQIVNTGNVTAKNVTFQDSPSEGVTFQSGSVVIINGTSSTPLPLDPTVGFTLNDLDVGNTVTITFAVTVDLVPPSQKVTNQATITFEHLVDPDQPVVSKTAYSNTVTTNVAVGNLSVTKVVDKEFATIGDYLTYTIVITNTGNIDVTNVNFIDQTPLNATFVLHSVYVNGTSKPTYHPAVGFLIGTLTKGQIVTVEYKVQVIS